MKEKLEWLLVEQPILTFALTLAIGIGIAVFIAYQEAQTFNRFKRADAPVATTWDALFAELRIEGCN